MKNKLYVRKIKILFVLLLTALISGCGQSDSVTTDHGQELNST
jgi:hypothetical protein